MSVPTSTDWTNLTGEELTQLKEEVRISRELRQQTSQRLPYLPTFSGDGGVKFSHYLSAIESTRASDQVVATAIRKSVAGSASKVIDSLDYSTSKAELVKQLKINFASVTSDTTAWERFYSATQSRAESLVEWRTRLHQLYRNTGTSTHDDGLLKDKLYQGLYNQRWKDLTAFRFEDEQASEADLFKLLRKTTEAQSAASSNAQLDARNQQLEKQVEELTSKVASLTTCDKEKSPKQPRRSNADNKLTGNYKGRNFDTNYKWTTRNKQDSHNDRTRHRSPRHQNWRSRDRSYSGRRPSPPRRRSPSRHDYRSRRRSPERQPSRHDRPYRSPSRHERQQRSPSRSRRYRRRSSERRSYSREDERRRHSREDQKHHSKDNGSRRSLNWKRSAKEVSTP